MNPQLPNPISKFRQPEARHPDTLDHILLDDALIPSSGFAASVLDSIAAITAQAAAPAPIPFPWKRALPGLAAFLIALIAAVRLAIQIRHSAAGSTATLPLDLAWFAHHPIANQTMQALAALAGAFLCLLLTRYLALGRSTR